MRPWLQMGELPGHVAVCNKAARREQMRREVTGNDGSTSDTHESGDATMTTNRSMYFSRTVLFAKREEGVMLVDMHDATVTEALDPWLGKVYLLADGSQTVQRLIDFVGRQYG